MITRRHLNNDNCCTKAVPRGTLDPPDNYKGKKHRDMNSSKPTLIFSVVSTFLLICTLYHQYLPNLLHEGSHRSMLQTSNLGVRGGMVGIGQSISVSDSDDSSDADADAHIKSLHRLITSTHQVIAVMPAKAAGSSMYHFSNRCNNATSYKEMGASFLNKVAAVESLLTKSSEMPGVISSHIYHPQTLVDIIKTVPRDTLLLYVHRQETSRLQSAVKQVLTHDCMETKDGGDDALKREGNSCSISEEDLLEVIKSGKNEIGTSTNHLLTCEVYEAIENYAPTMAFIDYQKANEVQELISEKYCPQLLGDPTVANVANEKDMQVHVRSNASSAADVTLDHWLATKSSMLEFALQLNKDATCVSKTRIMENQLYLNNGILFAPHTKLYYNKEMDEA